MKKILIIAFFGVLSLSAGSHRAMTTPQNSSLIQAVETQSEKVDKLLIRLRTADTLIKRN